MKKKEKVKEGQTGGCIMQIFGVVLLPFFPIGTLIGACLICASFKRFGKVNFTCSNCLAKVGKDSHKCFQCGDKL